MLTVICVVAVSFLCGTQACATIPGPDQNSTLGASKTSQITLTVSPPVEWTAPATGGDPAPGQSITKEKAKETAKKIIDTSIRALLVSHQFAVDSVTWTMTYDAPEILVGDCTDAVLNPTHGVIQGTVIYKCAANKVSGDYEVTITLDLTALVPVAQSQWDNMTAKLGDKLDSKGITVISITASQQSV